MVIPIGSAGPDLFGVTLQAGSPPAEIVPRLRIIKACLILIMASIMVRVAAGTVLSRFDIPISYMGIAGKVFVSVIGVFLLKDDQTIAPLHQCLVRTCCSSCEEQCQGGMPCLCMWFTCCALITAVFGCFPIDGSDMSESWKAVQLLCGRQEDRADMEGKWWWYVAWTSVLVASTVAFASQAIGAYQGLQGFQEFQARVEAEVLDAQAASGGFWGDERPGGGADSFLARQEDAFGGLGGGAFAGSLAGGAAAAIEHPRQGFAPFSGVGNRLWV